MNAVRNELNNEKQLTENGAVGYATSGKKLLDLNFATSSLRNKSEGEIIDMFIEAYYENPVLAIKWLFFCRDVRGGMGERRTFRVCMEYLADNQPDVAMAVLELISEYGRWDDLLCLLDSRIDKEVVELIRIQLNKDVENMVDNKPISLLAKWLPSENTSSVKTKMLAKNLIKKLNTTPRNYRKTLSMLRSYLKVVECDMSDNNWGAIDYSTVPSCANLKYSEAFLRNDKERRCAYLEDLKNGKTKINAGVLFPSDIVHQYIKGNYWSPSDYDEAIEQMWKALPDYVNGDGNTLVIRDGSGSMMSFIGGTNLSALDVSTALAIYFAEHSTGALKDKYITFGAKPKLVDMTNCKSLRDKIELSLRETDCSNTNIEVTFDLLLQTAISNNMVQEDMPKNLLIVSDMEFDEVGGGWHSRDRWTDTLFEAIQQRYKDAGYKMPRVIFWNVNSRTNTVPLQENDLGVALVSGFSPAIYSMVMSGELDPFKCLLEALSVERYQPVEDAIKDLF